MRESSVYIRKDKVRFVAIVKGILPGIARPRPIGYVVCSDPAWITEQDINTCDHGATDTESV